MVVDILLAIVFDCQMSCQNLSCFEMSISQNGIPGIGKGIIIVLLTFVMDLSAYSTLFLAQNKLVFADIGRSIPLLHLHGKASGCTPMPTLFKVMLLRLHTAMADRTAVPMSSLSRIATPA